MAKLIMDLSGIGGLAPRFYGDRSFSSSNQNLRIIGAENGIADGVCNPLTNYGYLSPANNTVANCTNPAAVIGSTIADTVNDKPYFWERGTKLHSINAYDGTTLDILRTVTGATGVDLEFYEVNGQRRLFYSYQKSGGGNIGIFDLASTYNDTWLSGTVSGAFNTGATNNVYMRVADNGFMYLLDGSAVHKIDGTTDGGANGTATANVLVFPAIFQLLNGLDYRGAMWLALIKNTRNLNASNTNTGVFTDFAGVYVWDRQSTKVNFVDFIPITGIREMRNIFLFNGVPHCFTVSSNRYTQIRVYNGTSFDVVEELGAEAYPRFPDAVNNTGDTIEWLGNDGIFYVYGKAHPTQSRNALYKIGNMTGNIDATAYQAGGAIVPVGKSVSVTTGDNGTPLSYYLSYTDNANALVRKWYPYWSQDSIASTNQNPHTGTTYSMVKILPKFSQIKSLTLFYPAKSTSGSTVSLNLDVYFNQSTTSWGTTALTRDDAARGYKFIPIGKSGINYLQLGFSWPANGLSVSILPQYAEIEYEPTAKKV